MVEGDEGEGEEAPEDEGMGEAGEGPFADDFGLAEDFPDEVADARAEGEEMEVGVATGGADFGDDEAEAPPEEVGAGEDERDEEELLGEREGSGFGEDAKAGSQGGGG